MSFNFSGKTALVTGATKGIGRDIAIQLSKCGAKVIATGRSKDLLALPRIIHPNVKIVGGHDTDITLHPWQISIRFDDDHVCGGFLISDEWILTAAHCTTLYKDLDIYIKVGSTYRSTGGEEYNISQIISHPEYQNNFDYDIALIKLVKAVNNPNASAIDLPDENEKLTTDTLKQEVPDIKTIELDVTDWNKTEQVLKNAGPIDLLVNNAGLGWLKSMLDITEEDVDSVFAVNSKAVINVTRLIVQNLLARNAPGSIVNLSSQASMVGLMHHTVYCASKGAVDAFTRAAALEYGPKNIRINAVNPTVILTDMGRLGWSDPKIAKPMLEKIPLRRFGEVREVTDAVLYLLSDQSSMITGVCLPIDGGYTSS